MTNPTGLTETLASVEEKVYKLIEVTETQSARIAELETALSMCVETLHLHRWAVHGCETGNLYQVEIRARKVLDDA